MNIHDSRLPIDPLISFPMQKRCKYVLHLQVMSLSPAPLSLLIKAAPILTEDMYGDIQPAAWELLLSVDEHMAAAAGLFLILLQYSYY